MNKNTPLKSFLVLSFFLISNNLLANNYEVLDRIVVSVEKDVVTQREINEEISKKLKSNDIKKIPANDLKEIQKETIKYLIKKKLIEQYAKRLNLEPSNEEIDLIINNILKENNITLELLQKELINSGSNFDDFKMDLIYKLTIQKIKDREIMPYVNVSKYEIDSLLKVKKTNSDQKYKLSHILIKHENPKKEIYIKSIKNLKDPADFPSLAIKYSDGPYADKGGDLGWNKKDDLPSIFVDFVTSAKPNEISQEIESSNGIHFLKLEDISKENEEKKVLVRQYKFQQILLKNNVISSDDDQSNKLINIKNSILDGLDFSKAIKLYSDDQFNIDPNKINWINFDDLLPEFRDKIIAFPKENLIGPFKTQLGWHLVKVYDFREADFTSEAEHQRIKIEIARNKAELRFEDWLEALITNSKIKYFDDN